MKKFVFCILIFAFAQICTSNLFSQGYEIKVKIKNLHNDTLILGHHFNKSMYPDDTLIVNKNGYGIFKKKKSLPGGMYLILLPTKNYFDILLSDNQTFSIENDTCNFLKNMKVTGSLDNQLFYDYQRLIVDKRDEAKSLQVKREQAKTPEEKASYSNQLKAIDQEVKNFRTKVQTENPNLFFAKFIKAVTEIDVPDFPRDAKGKVTDSTFQYRYYRSHYFDNFDVSDPRFLRTPFYEDKVKTYIEKVVPQVPDTLIPEVDMLIEKSRTSNELFRYMLVTMFNHFAASQIMGMDAVLVHIAEKYYIPEATWSDTSFISKLKKQIARIKPNLIGSIAPNIMMMNLPDDHFIKAKTDTALRSNVYAGNPIYLHNIKAKFLVMIFWEATCSHCQKAMPVMYDVYKKIKDKGAEVMAINILGGIEGKKKWVDYVNEHGLYGWMNVWNPYDFSFKDKYDIYSTPVIYVLDENKKIIAKRINPEQVEDIINFELKKKKNN